MPLLINATTVQQKGIVKLLLDNRADLNIVFRNGLTPLSTAAYIGDKAIVELQLEYGLTKIQKMNLVLLL